MHNRHRVRQRLFLLALAFLFAGSNASSISAQDATPTLSATPDASQNIPLFAIYPKDTGPRTFFDVKQEAGTTKSYTVVMINAGTAEQGPFKGRTFAVNVRTKVNGGLESGGPNDPKSGVTSWLDYPNEVFTLEPGTGIERTFKVTVPEDTAPGQYITALCYETADPLEIEGVENLKQNIRQTIAFYVNVPGDVKPSFSVRNLAVISETEWSGIQADIVNSGNILVRPEGKLTVSDPSGKLLLTMDIGFGAFFAGQTGRIETGFGNALPAGEYLVTIELRDPETGASAILENQNLATTTRGALAVAKTSPIGFGAASAQIQPSAENPQFLNIDTTVENNGDPVMDAQLSLQVMRDGKLVENYVVVSPLALPQGETLVSNRYIPLNGWSAGTWTFSLSIQQLDRETGVSQVLTSVTLGEPIVIP